MQTKTDEVLKVEEVARILRIPRSRAYLLVQQGEIPSFRIGERSVRVHRRALEEYMGARPEPITS